MLNGVQACHVGRLLEVLDDLQDAGLEVQGQALVFGEIDDTLFLCRCILSYEPRGGWCLTKLTDFRNPDDVAAVESIAPQVNDPSAPALAK
jgi:hypothetical protein